MKKVSINVASIFMVISMMVLCAGNVFAYPQGQTTDVNIPELEKRASQGDAEAQFELGLAFYEGEIAPKDVPTALKWFEAAAKNKHAWAYNNLAVIYALGDGVKYDPIKAYGYASVALALDFTLDKQFLTDLEEIMSKKEISQAKKYAEKLKKEIAK